jgi:hypothetical protein
MANWVSRVSKLFSQEAATGKPPTAPAARAPAAVVPQPAASATAPSAPPVLPPDLDDALFDWLAGTTPGPEGAASATESGWLAELDGLIAADKGKGELLPRAAGVIPPLLNSLRDENQSSTELSQRVARDPNLVAEVTRLGNSVTFRGAEAVTELADAVRRVGTAGVRQAIAKVVLKPMFDAQSGLWSSHAAPLLWAHSQAQADLCRAIGVARGLDPFEAYLGGLLDNIGWTAGLRALERVLERHPNPSGLMFSRGFKEGFKLRRERLFVQFVTAWRLNPALHAAARDVQQAGSFVSATDPLAQVLLAGDRLASLRMLASAGRVQDDEAVLLEPWPEDVRAAYAAIG